MLPLEVKRQRRYLLTDWLLLQSFPWQHLVAGAAGGAISRTATAPLELLRLQAMTTSGKVHVQGDLLVHERRPHLIHALKAATGGQGWQGLWRGNGLNVLRAGPQKAIDFFSFEVYKVMSQPVAKQKTVHTCCLPLPHMNGWTATAEYANALHGVNSWTTND